MTIIKVDYPYADRIKRDNFPACEKCNREASAYVYTTDWYRTIYSFCSIHAKEFFTKNKY
jgi:hypothetical protein